MKLVETYRGTYNREDIYLVNPNGRGLLAYTPYIVVEGTPKLQLFTNVINHIPQWVERNEVERIEYGFN